jgi:aldehyde:ferredoxin oxidoreductase
MAKFITIDMTDDRITLDEAPAKYTLLGGRGLTSTLVSEHVDPGCDPLGGRNVLVFAPGLLGGTAVPSSGRLSIGAKSPLTGGIKESNAGGTAATYLARNGIKALIIKGCPEDINKPKVLVINNQGAYLDDGTPYAGLGNYVLANKLREVYGEKISTITVGSGADKLYPTLGIAVSDMEGNPGRFAGRGGLGAVMASKGLKAIVVHKATAQPQAAKKEAFRKAVSQFTKILKEHPVTSQGLASVGTAGAVGPVNEAGVLPTKNFSSGQFDKAAEISGEKQAELAKARGGIMGHQCSPGCVIRCSNTFVNAKGKPIVSPLEYETVVLMGSNLCISDLDKIAEMNRICNDIGIDTIEVGVAIGVAMEAGVLEFGDADKAIDLLYQVEKGTLIGMLIGQGTQITGKVLGVKRIPCAKKQAFAGYLPSSAKDIGVTYATSPMGADHTAGYTIASSVYRMGGILCDPLQPEGQIALSRAFQINTAALNNTGLCDFTTFGFMDNPQGIPLIADIISSFTGQPYTAEDHRTMGLNLLKLEASFNEQAGLGKVTNRLPEFLAQEKLSPHNTTFDVPENELADIF